MRSSETPPTGNRGRNKAIRGRLPLPVSSSFDRSAPSAPRKDSPAHLLPPRPDRTRLSPPPGRGTLRRGAGSATGPAVTGRQAPDAVRPPGGRGVSRARACAVAAAAPRRSRSTATRTEGRGRPGGAAGATAPAPPAGRLDGYGYAPTALAGARLMPAAPPPGRPGGYGCLPTVPLPGRPGGYGYAPAAPRVPRPCLPCRRLAVPTSTAACRPRRRVAAPALRLPADRAAGRPPRRYGYPPTAPPAGRPGVTATRRPTPWCPAHARCAATGPSRRLRLPVGRGTRPGAARTYPAGRARCGPQAWLLACVGHGHGRPRPGRPGLSQAGVLPCAGPRCGHPRARPCPASSLRGCASEARSRGGWTRRHPAGAGPRTPPARTGTGALRAATSETSASASRAAAVPPSPSAAAPGPATPEPPPAPSGTGPAAVGARPPSRPRRPRHRRLHRPSKRRPCRKAGPPGSRGPRGPTDSHDSAAQALLHHPSPSLPPSPDRTI